MGFWWELFNAPLESDDEQWDDFMGESEVTGQ